MRGSLLALVWVGKKIKLIYTAVDVKASNRKDKTKFRYGRSPHNS
jgi:hypothetical protein